MIIKMSEVDVFFLSYDEPKKEEFWVDLVNKVPWAKRVDGVTGFDNAHKECARQSETEFFVTVDADNIVDTEFFDQQLYDDWAGCYSWKAVNAINGLRYGNGGLKLWRKDYVLNMKSHENSDDDKHTVDFCWEDVKYIQMHNSYSTTHPNQSALHSFRAGLREGVKMSLDQGVRLTPETVDKMWYGNRERLMIWMNIGNEVEFGKEAIIGARIGCYKTLYDHSWDYSQIKDFEFCKSEFENMNYDAELVANSLNKIALYVSEPVAENSMMFKLIYKNYHKNLDFDTTEKQANKREKNRLF